jgi:hypothetical protein
METFEKKLNTMNKITAAITAVEPMFQTLSSNKVLETIVDTNDSGLLNRN